MAHGHVLRVACAAFLLSVACGAFVANPSSTLSKEKREVIEKLWRIKMPVSDRILRRGLKFEVDGRQWPRLVKKLTTPGSTVTVVVYGGSVSVGYKQCNTSYPDELVVWMRDAFPGVTVRMVNLARRATAATFAALCMVNSQPPDADLILIEYSVNGWGGTCQCATSAQVSGWETLVRKAIRRSPRAALLGFATFLFEQGGRPAEYYETGEDQQAVVARRYGIPMMSIRDAMYDEMMDPDDPHGISRTKMLVDIVHPGDEGSKLYAALLGWALRHQVTRMMLHAHQLDHEALESEDLPRPMVPEAAQEDWPTYCAEGEAIKGAVVDKSGFSFVDEGSNACDGCHKYGLAATGAGAWLSFRVNSDILSEAERSKVGEVPDVMLALSYLRASNTGKARLECVKGCKCESAVIDTKAQGHTSEIYTQRFVVSPAGECVVKVTVLEETSTSGKKFRLSSFAVHKRDKVLTYAYAPVHDRRLR